MRCLGPFSPGRTRRAASAASLILSAACQQSAETLPPSGFPDLGAGSGGESAEPGGESGTDDTGGTGGAGDEAAGGSSSNEAMGGAVNLEGGSGGQATTDGVVDDGATEGDGVQGTRGGPECNGSPGPAAAGESPLPAGCTRHVGPSFDEFFAEDKLATLRIEIPDDELEGFARDQWVDLLWEKWSHCAPFDPVRVRVEYESPDGVGDVAMDDVAMRFRGSWPEGTNAIQGFKLDVQAFHTPGPEGKRRFADMNRINVLSVERDDSHVIPCLSYSSLRAAGLPAPRCNHLMVYVNDEYYGLMGNVEQVNDGYTRRHFGSSAGSLYGGSPSHGDCEGGFEDSLARFVYSDDSFSSYADQYELTSATAADAEANLIPMLRCGDADETPDDDAFRTCMTDWIDVDQWLLQVAAESAMPSLESMVGYYRNFYLYFAPDGDAPQGGRFSVWSWDLDTSFQRQRCTPSDCDVFTAVASFYGPRNQRAPLLTRLTTAFRPEYCDALRRFVDTSMNTTRLDAMQETLRPGLDGEPSVSLADWEGEMSAIRQHLEARASEVLGQLDAQCP